MSLLKGTATGLLGGAAGAGIAYAVEKTDPNSRTNLAKRSQRWLKRHQTTASMAGMKRGIRAQAGRALATDKRRMEDELQRQGAAGVNRAILEQRRNLALGRAEEARAQSGASAERAAIAQLGQERAQQQAIVAAAPTTAEVLSGGFQAGLGVLSAGSQIAGAIPEKKEDQFSVESILDLANSRSIGSPKLHSVNFG